MTVPLEVVLARLKLRGLQNAINRRFDRCCHDGEVGLRLPLMYRLDVANRPRE